MHVRVDWNINTKLRLVRNTSTAKVNNIKEINSDNNDSHVVVEANKMPNSQYIIWLTYK